MIVVECTVWPLLCICVSVVLLWSASVLDIALTVPRSVGRLIKQVWLEKDVIVEGLREMWVRNEAEFYTSRSNRERRKENVERISLCSHYLGETKGKLIVRRCPLHLHHFIDTSRNSSVERPSKRIVFRIKKRKKRK